MYTPLDFWKAQSEQFDGNTKAVRQRALATLVRIGSQPGALGDAARRHVLATANIIVAQASV